MQLADPTGRSAAPYSALTLYWYTTELRYGLTGLNHMVPDEDGMRARDNHGCIPMILTYFLYYTDKENREASIPAANYLCNDANTCMRYNVALCTLLL
jgi:hypothetical protein